MASRWTLEERAAKWFPLLSGEQIKKGLRLMRVGHRSFDNSSSDNPEFYDQIGRIGSVLDLPPDIRENSEQLHAFLLVLQKLMLGKRRFTKLRLGMRVRVNKETGRIVKLNRRNFDVTIRLCDFYNESKIINAGEVSPVFLRDK